MAKKRKEIPIPSARRVREIRESLGLTQAEAAERVLATQGLWSAWESGARRPSRQSALLLKLLSENKI